MATKNTDLTVKNSMFWRKFGRYVLKCQVQRKARDYYSKCFYSFPLSTVRVRCTVLFGGGAIKGCYYPLKETTSLRLGHVFFLSPFLITRTPVVFTLIQ